MTTREPTQTMLSPKIWALIVLQIAVILGAGFWTMHSLYINMHRTDLTLYYSTSLRLMLGQTVYRDFPLEYPPGALPAFYLPQMFGFGTPLSLYHYIVAFLVQSALLSTGIALLLVQLTKRGTFRQSPTKVLAAYIVLVAICSPLLPWRYDLFPAMLTLLSLWCLLRGYPLLAGIALGLGVAAKLYPIVLLPIFIAYLLVSKQNRASVLLAVACIVTAAASLLPFLHVLPKMMYFVHYHQLRGLEVESVPAGLLLLAHKLRLTQTSIVYNFGSFNVAAPGANQIVHILPLIFVLAYGIILWQGIKKFREEQTTHGQINPNTLVIYIVAALLTFILSNKVFSTQYIIWLLPFAPLLRGRQVALVAVVYVLSVTIFPFDFGGLMSLKWPSVLVLNARNLLLFFLLGWLVFKPVRLPSAQLEQNPALYQVPACGISKEAT